MEEKDDCGKGGGESTDRPKVEKKPRNKGGVAGMREVENECFVRKADVMTLGSYRQIYNTNFSNKIYIVATFHTHAIDIEQYILTRFWRKKSPKKRK
jgi:hypothetical protein